MYLKYTFLACVICAASGLDIPKKLKTNIFYQSLGHGSIHFFTNNFEQYYTKLHSFVDFHLVPFGRAEVHKNATHTNVTCLNGPVECHGNEVQACAIKHLQSTDKLIKFIVCVMNHTNATHVTEATYPAQKCIDLIEAPEFTMPILQTCLDKEAMSLMEKCEAETKQLGTVHGFPIITINADPFDTQLSSELLKDFQGAVCQKLVSVPGASEVCGNTNSSTLPPHPTTPHPSAATIVSTGYLPLFVALLLTVLLEVKLLY